jgi:hypothetical protein
MTNQATRLSACVWMRLERAWLFLFVSNYNEEGKFGEFQCARLHSSAIVRHYILYDKQTTTSNSDFDVRYCLNLFEQ